MKNGFLTSEFLSQILGPYGIALAILYYGSLDAEMMELLRQAISGLSQQVQAAVLLLMKFGSLLGAAYVGKQGAVTTQAYVQGRVALKKQEADCQK